MKTNASSTENKIFVKLQKWVKTHPYIQNNPNSTKHLRWYSSDRKSE